MTSVFETLNLPESLQATIGTFIFLLFLSPYMSGLDFGIFKIPLIKSGSTKRLLKITGPILIAIFILLIKPFKVKDNLLSTEAWIESSFTPQVRFTKSNNLEIDAYDCNHVRWIQEPILKPNTKYQLTFSIKIEKVESLCKTPDAGKYPWGANVWIFRDGQSQKEQISISKRFYGSSDWQTNTIDFNSKEGNDVKIQLQIGGHGGLAKGKAWFKDITLYEK